MLHVTVQLCGSQLKCMMGKIDNKIIIIVTVTIMFAHTDFENSGALLVVYFHPIRF